MTKLTLFSSTLYKWLSGKMIDSISQVQGFESSGHCHWGSQYSEKSLNDKTDIFSSEL
jgi:hypothetical protein